MKFKEALKKLEGFYFFGEIKIRKNYEKRFEFLRKYILFKQLNKRLKRNEISKQLSIPYGTIGTWDRKEQIPHLYRIIKALPGKRLKKNCKWLPVNIDEGWNYTDFIQVPLKITSYKDIEFVLKQLDGINYENSKIKNKHFENISKDEALAYIIGLMVSDADKDRGSTTISTRFRLGLSKVHKDNILIGEFACYCLSRLDIKAKKVKDGKPSIKAPNGRFLWRSQYSPLLTWMKICCLGLNKKQTTTYNPIRADWIFNSPQEFRKAVLNGIYDGDGCVYERGWQITNACGPNQVFLQKLLWTFNIKSKIRGPKVIIETKEDLRKASELYLFRYSLYRIEKSKKLIRMLKNSKYIHSHKDYQKIIARILELNSLGYKPRDIPSEIFNEFSVDIHPRRIYSIIKEGIK